MANQFRFKTKNSYLYFQITFASKYFESARSAANTITCMDDIKGFDMIRDDERMMILELMDQVNTMSKKSILAWRQSFPNIHQN